MITGTAAEPVPVTVDPPAPAHPTIAAAASRVVDISSGPLQVRLAESATDIDAAQALRYRIFYEKLGARPLPGMEQQRRDSDAFDPICDHLLVLDLSRGSGLDAVVGTYRLIRREAAARHGAFYSAAEYDIAPRSSSLGGPASMPAIARVRSCNCCGAASPPMFFTMILR